MTPLSNIPVPLTDQTPISDLKREHCVFEYRPTPQIEQELFNNARVIHGITSVQNRISLKRNSMYNQKYERYLETMKSNSSKTSYNIFEKKPEVNDAKESEDQNSVGSHPTIKTASPTLAIS
jgi:hypothetical protein